MTGGENEEIFRRFYHNQTTGIAVVPYSFGTIKTHGALTGTLLYDHIKEYIDEAPNER